MRDVILKHAIPLIRTHGFSRQTLSVAVLSLPNPHAEPLSDTAVSALFGPGDEARKTLIHAWLEKGIDKMGRINSAEEGEKTKGSISVRDALHDRLMWNEPVLGHLKEAFALLSVPQTAAPLPLLDPRPAMSHAASIANEACLLGGDTSIGTAWYAKRASLAIVYTAAELHQLTSPTTAFDFLDTLLESSNRAHGVVSNVGQYANFFLRSWSGILNSRGIF